MKKLIGLPLSLICLQLKAQQSTIKGIVSIHNSETNTGRRQYVANAQIEDDARRAQPTITNVNGEFTLIYVGIPDRTSVSFQVKKPSLVVVDTSSLNAVTGQFEVVRISMAFPDSIAEYRRKIYNVGKTGSEKKLEIQVARKNAELAALGKRSSQNIARIKQLEQELAELESKREKIEEQSRELAKKYADVNLDDVSPAFRNAFIFFQKGQLDTALSILTKANPASTVYQLLEEQDRLDRMKNEIQQRDSIIRVRRSGAIEFLRLKADLHKTAFEFDSTAACYQLLLKLDSSSHRDLFDYAVFLAWLNRRDEAIYYYSKALALIRRQSSTGPQAFEPEIATLQNNLGILYQDKNDFSRAETAFLQSLEIRQRLGQTNPQTFDPDMAATQENLGVLYRVTNDLTHAEAAYLQALQIYRRLAATNPQIYEPYIALTQNNLGNLYRAKRDLPHAEAAFLDALQIRMRLARDNPQSYEPGIAAIQNNLGLLYSDKRDLARAETSFQGALEIFQRLARTNPQIYEPKIAITQNNLGTLYLDKNDPTRAEAALLDADRIFKSLAQMDPQTYEPSIAAIQNNLGNLYSDKNDLARAEAAYLQTLEICQRLARTSPQTYEPRIASTQSNLGLLYTQLKKYGSAERSLEASIRIREKLMQISPETYSARWKKTVLNLVEVYVNVIDTIGAEETRIPVQLKILALYDKIYRSDTTDKKIREGYARHYGNLSWYQLFARQFEAAGRSAKKGLEIDNTQVWIKSNLAHALLLQNSYDMALKIYQELKPLKNTDGKTYASVCIDDLAQLEGRHITNKDFGRVRQFLQQ